ncbi:MAG: hypothetical protein EBY22_15635, partial [Gammaproteobacteria bacterium]|nr:hypothetical protein [Gammaproteobacteria bacterium]
HHITKVDTLCQFVKEREIPQRDKKIEVQTFLATLPDVIQSFNQDLLMKTSLDLLIKSIR